MERLLCRSLAQPEVELFSAPTPRVHFFISHGVGHLVGQAEDMRDLESSSQSVQLSLDYVAFDQLEAGTKAVPPACGLAPLLSVSAEVCCHARFLDCSIPLD